jgi:hypothetical protein
LLARASELRSPESPSHFLRIFGQSSREFIEGGSTEANVSQFLALFNGFVESRLIGNSEAVLNQASANENTIDGKIDVIFTSILSRTPTEVERQAINRMIRKQARPLDDRDWSDDLIWALVNSHEFVFIQ